MSAFSFEVFGRSGRPTRKAAEALAALFDSLAEDTGTFATLEVDVNERGVMLIRRDADNDLQEVTISAVLDEMAAMAREIETECAALAGEG